MASSLSIQLSPSERQYILDGCADNCRSDGRDREEFRLYTIVSSSSASEETTDPPLILSNGSARLFLSSSGGKAATHILCSIKAELGHPSEERPHQGSLQIHVEDSLAGASSAKRQSEKDRNYLQSILVDVLGPTLLDLDALCILPYHYAFQVNVDVEILSGTAGNLIDACSHVIRAALENTFLPKVIPSSAATNNNNSKDPTGSTSSDLILESDMAQAVVPAGSSVVGVTVTVCLRSAIDNNSQQKKSFLLLLDASLEEESCSYCQVHVAVDTGEDSGEEPVVCALRKTGEGSVPWDLLPEITALAIRAVPKAKNAYKSSIKNALVSGHSKSLLQGQFEIQ